MKIILVCFSIRKMVIPWTNYQRNLTEQYSCIKAQTQALKSQLNWKQQQYKTLLMKGPKGKEKIRETRRQIEQLLQLVKRKFESLLYQFSFLFSHHHKIFSNYQQIQIIFSKLG
jgi:hypothetical protein